MSIIRVGVLRGGLGHEFDVSLKTGASVLKNLPTEKYQAKDILITKDGMWHLEGLPTSMEKVIGNVDVVFNALHGQFGEDGQVQNMLDSAQIPYTGSGQVASSLGMNKELTKNLFRINNIKTPQGVYLDKETIDGLEVESVAYDVFRKIPPPWIIKPSNSGSSVGLFLARTYDQLIKCIEACFQVSDTVLVEEFIRGREATCGVVDGLRNQEYYTLSPIEIIPPDKKLFDYDAKYSGESQEICPGRFKREEKDNLQNLAIKVHKLLGLRHYSRSDFILSPRGIYTLEVNTLPGLTEQSLIPKSLNALGVSYSEFLDHVISLALTKK
ncbi:MAG: D-alanine--D-alanine ligase [Candidatus Vogelbacteria bacterium]|nr:D-alanine--D-alanine ligase [Candidatus Vogelbacteria bacterium]